jgi:hypothetical protein
MYNVINKECIYRIKAMIFLNYLIFYLDVRFYSAVIPCKKGLFTIKFNIKTSSIKVGSGDDFTH